MVKNVLATLLVAAMVATSAGKVSINMTKIAIQKDSVVDEVCNKASLIDLVLSKNLETVQRIGKAALRM